VRSGIAGAHALHDRQRKVGAKLEARPELLREELLEIRRQLGFPVLWPDGDFNHCGQAIGGAKCIEAASGIRADERSDTLPLGCVEGKFRAGGQE
jgi:hypothetical protein